MHKNADDIYDLSWGWMSHLRKKWQKYRNFLGGWNGKSKNSGGMDRVWYHPIDVLAPLLSMFTPDMIILGPLRFSFGVITQQQKKLAS